jgi:alpha-methylacyl-CoA racemase
MDKKINSSLLQGVKVLDFTALLPGPFATVMLADLGAEVIKVEPPVGDFTRRMSPLMFSTANRNKRSFTIDLKNPDAAGVIERLVKWADVAIEGFRPGVVDRLGIGPLQLRTIKPSLIYCSVSGYGQTGPWRLWPGHDGNYLAASGALSFVGHWNDQRPRRSGIPVADLAGASYSTILILAALARARATSEGATIDISLTEAAMSFMSVRAGIDCESTSRSHIWPTNDLFETADGRTISLGIVEEHFWTGFVNAAADVEPRLLELRFGDEPGRRRHGDDLFPIIASALGRRTASDWLERFENHDVPAQLVVTQHEATTGEYAKSRGLVMEAGGERHLPFPALVDGKPAGRLDRLAPVLGEHSHDILRELGFGVSEIEKLAASGTVKFAKQ